MVIHAFDRIQLVSELVLDIMNEWVLYHQDDSLPNFTEGLCSPALRSIDI
jgi:hypothetical protein